MNLDQTTEQIIKNADAVQRILWNSIFLRFGNNVGISQISYIGPQAGSEFIVYSVNKMYFLLELSAFFGAMNINISSLIIYNAANVAIGTVTNINGLWNGTTAAANYVGNAIHLKNILISRITSALYSNIKLIGYRLSF